MTLAEAVPPKKLYSQPTLRVYGKVQDLTQSGAMGGSTMDTRGFFMDTRTH